jgi:hypothetical protein
MRAPFKALLAMLTTVLFLGFSYVVLVGVSVLGFGDGMDCFEAADYVQCERRAAGNMVGYAIVGIGAWVGMLWLVLKLWGVGLCFRKS